MVKIEIFRNGQGRAEGFAVSGHANAAAYGKDIVCAAVSALAQTAVLGVGKHLGREIDFSVAKGNLRMRLLAAPDALSDAVIETMVLGLREIEKINPRNVQISERGR